MKRTWKQVMRDAGRLLWADLRNLWVAGLVFGGYFLVGRRFLYSLCPVVVLTGFPCPGCGLTRATFSILQGHFADAWFLHPFAYAVLLFLLVFGVRRYLLLKETKSLMKWLGVLLLGMLVFYVYRMVRYFPGEPPMSYYRGSVAYRVYQILRNAL